MGNTESISGMSGRLRLIAVATLAMLTLCLLWLFYDLFAYIEIKEMSSASEIIGRLSGMGFLARICLFLLFAVLLVKSFRNGVKAGSLMIITIVSGAISVIALFFDFAALDDIGTDYLEYGYKCTMEWRWLFGSLLLRLAFFISLGMLIFRILKYPGALSQAAQPVVDEIIFEVTQWVGIVSGLAGVAFTIYAFYIVRDFAITSWMPVLLVIYCSAIILPWFGLTVYWIIRFMVRRNLSFYDEKQKHDIAFSGMTALLVSIPLMTIIYAVNLGNASIAGMFLWLPFYLFSTLLVFSMTLLVRYRRG